MSFGGLLAHLSITKALTLAPASLVGPLDFLRLPLIVVVGMVMFGEPFDPIVMLGAALTGYVIRPMAMGWRLLLGDATRPRGRPARRIEPSSHPVGQSPRGDREARRPVAHGPGRRDRAPAAEAESDDAAEDEADKDA